METENKNKKNVRLVLFGCALVLLIGVGVYKYFEPAKTVEEENVTQVEKTQENTIRQENNEKPEKEETEKTTVKQQHLANNNTDSSAVDETNAEEMETEKDMVHSAKKELASIYVSPTKSLFASGNASAEAFKSQIEQPEHASFGKIYYDGENGRLESSLRIDEDGDVKEYLHSYDPHGNQVDMMEIGSLDTEMQEKKYASLSVNKLSVFYLFINPKSGKKEERVTEYSITPQLRFNKGKTFIKV